MTRSAAKAGLLRELGAEPAVCDVFDPGALTRAMAAFRPDVVFHQLTDLPDKASDVASFADRDDRIRGEGTRNLLGAAAAAGAMPSLTVPPGATMVVDDRALADWPDGS